jgi:hypothetical protein
MIDGIELAAITPPKIWVCCKVVDALTPTRGITHGSGITNVGAN